MISDGSYANGKMADFVRDGAVTLYHDNSPKIATTATGIDVTGIATMDGLTVNVSADSDSVATITSSATANNTQLRLGTSGNDSVISGSGGSNGGLKFKVYGSEKMAISSAGNVTINGGNLDVTGNIAVTGTVDGIDIAARDAVLNFYYYDCRSCTTKSWWYYDWCAGYGSLRSNTQRFIRHMVS